MVGNITPECRRILTKLQQADFYAQDLKLYLDTHPDDDNALRMYREAVKQAKMYRKEFERKCYPLRAENAGENGKWNWLSGLWI